VAKSEAESWLAQFGNPGLKEVPLWEIKDDLSRYLRRREARNRYHASWQPAGVLIGFESEEDWFDYRLEHDPRFLRAH